MLPSSPVRQPSPGASAGESLLLLQVCQIPPPVSWSLLAPPLSAGAGGQICKLNLSLSVIPGDFDDMTIIEGLGC